MLSTLFRVMSHLCHSFLQVTLYATTLQCCLPDPFKKLHQGLLLLGLLPPNTLPTQQVGEMGLRSL